jgi:hypothetical protein
VCDSDGGVAGETPAAVTCLVNAGGHWQSRLAAASQSQSYIVTDGQSV